MTTSTRPASFHPYSSILAVSFLFLNSIRLLSADGFGLIASNGEIWAEIRRFTLLAFRNMGVGRDLMEERILAELDARCADIDAKAIDGKTIVHTTEFFDLTVGSVINSLLVGKRFEEHNKDEFLHIRHLMHVSENMFSLFDLTMPVWVLQKFFPKRYKLAAATQLNVLDYVSREAMQRADDVKTGKCELNMEEPRDLVDAFLVRKQREDEKGGHPAYTLKSLQHLLADLWFAGQDTTATTLVSGFNQFVNNPRVIEKARKELLEITGGARALSLQDRSQTHYLNAVIAEIQRHASILTVNFWRINHEPTTIKGYPVDSGAMITAQLGALQVNDDIFKNPCDFYPERFIENEKLLSQVIPFGIGKRSCVGENLARAELYLIFGNLLLRYDFKPHGAMPSTHDHLPYSAGKRPDTTAKLEFVKTH